MFPKIPKYLIVLMSAVNILVVYYNAAIIIDTFAKNIS